MVAVMVGAAVTTLPCSISQIQRFIHSIASRARFTGRIPLINESDFNTLFRCDVLQLQDEIGESQIANLSSPQGFDAL